MQELWNPLPAASSAPETKVTPHSYYCITLCVLPQCYLLPTTYCLLPTTTDYLPLTTYCLLSLYFLCSWKSAPKRWCHAGFLKRSDFIIYIFFRRQDSWNDRYTTPEAIEYISDLLFIRARYVAPRHRTSVSPPTVSAPMDGRTTDGLLQRPTPTDQPTDQQITN
jgi:hypothetical protein